MRRLTTTDTSDGTLQRVKTPPQHVWLPGGLGLTGNGFEESTCNAAQTHLLSRRTFLPLFIISGSTFYLIPYTVGKFCNSLSIFQNLHNLSAEMCWPDFLATCPAALAECVRAMEVELVV